MPFRNSALPDAASPGGFREMARFSALRGRDLGDLAWTSHSPAKKSVDTDRGLLRGRVAHS